MTMTRSVSVGIIILIIARFTPPTLHYHGSVGQIQQIVDAHATLGDVLNCLS